MRRVLLRLLPIAAFGLVVAAGFLVEPYVRAFAAEYYTTSRAVAFLLVWLADSYQAFAWYSKQSSEIHPAQVAASATIGAAAFASGLDPLQAFGVAVVADFFFQIAVNAASSLPLINRNERRTYRLQFLSFDEQIPKTFSGLLRVAEVPIGAVFVYYEPIIVAFYA
jgi:hypothetical protein